MSNALKIKSDRYGSDNKFSDIATRLVSRRKFMGGLIAGSSIVALGGLGACSNKSVTIGGRDRGGVRSNSTLTFKELPLKLDEYHHVAEGYSADVLLRWGDALFPDSKAFKPYAQSFETQIRQFGDNCDYIAYMPLAEASDVGAWSHFVSNNSDRGLLCVNHEHTRLKMMFDSKSGSSIPGLSKKEIGADMAAHGHSIVEVRRDDENWEVALDSPFNRRISPITPMAISGPVAGHPRLITKADPDARQVMGTIANCGGGVTPWGTILIAEENFRKFFNGDAQKLMGTHPREAVMHRRFDIAEAEHYWHLFDDRFDIEKEPHEPNRFGWVVEIDPYQPDSTPVKRTALGRFQHEAATVVAKDRQPVVVYSGDDSPNEYLYRFVSKSNYLDGERDSNLSILDEGTLYVAKFYEDGTGVWLPLRHGENGLTQDNGFDSQADILIDARMAADAVGATKMDRPEDVETNPSTDRVYVSLTKNTEREQINPANPRAHNPYGHMLEISPPGEDGNRQHTATEFQWDIFFLGDDPRNAIEPKDKSDADSIVQDAGVDQAELKIDVVDDGGICNPDNIAFDPKGRIWVATDGLNDFGTHDGLWAAETVGPTRAQSKHFFGCPVGAELCGPCFTPDGKTLFVAVQHPGDYQNSSFSNPATRWPDFKQDMPPRASVVVITKHDGGDIGS